MNNITANLSKLVNTPIVVTPQKPQRNFKPRTETKAEYSKDFERMKFTIRRNDFLMVLKKLCYYKGIIIFKENKIKSFQEDRSSRSMRFFEYDLPFKDMVGEALMETSVYDLKKSIETFSEHGLDPKSDNILSIEISDSDLLKQITYQEIHQVKTGQSIPFQNKNMSERRKEKIVIHDSFGNCYYHSFKIPEKDDIDRCETEPFVIKDGSPFFQKKNLALDTHIILSKDMLLEASRFATKMHFDCYDFNVTGDQLKIIVGTNTECKEFFYTIRNLSGTDARTLLWQSIPIIAKTFDKIIGVQFHTGTPAWFYEVGDNHFLGYLAPPYNAVEQ